MTKILYKPILVILIGGVVVFPISCFGSDDDAERHGEGLYAEESVHIRLRYTISSQVNETTILYEAPESWSRESSPPLRMAPDITLIGDQAWERANGAWRRLDDSSALREEFAALFDDYNRLARALESVPSIQEGHEVDGEPTGVKVSQGEFSPFEGQGQQEAKVVVGRETGRIYSIEVSYAASSPVSAVSVDFDYSTAVSIEKPE